MSDELPTVDGLYLDREDMVWRRTGTNLRCIQAPGEGYDTSNAEEAAELAQWAPFVRLVPLADEELTHLHRWAEHREHVDRAYAAYDQAHGVPQPELTRRLTSADHWRAIRQKTGDQ